MGRTPARHNTLCLKQPSLLERALFFGNKIRSLPKCGTSCTALTDTVLRIIGSVHEITQEGAAWLSKVLNGLLTSNVSSRYMFPPLFVFIILPRVED